MYAPHLLYTFLCQWTLGLLPSVGYCKQRGYGGMSDVGDNERKRGKGDKTEKMPQNS